MLVEELDIKICKEINLVCCFFFSLQKNVNKPVVSKPVVKSKFAAFRQQMKKKQEEIANSPGLKVHKEEEKVFEAPGFFTVSSPVRTPKLKAEGM